MNTIAAMSQRFYALLHNNLPVCGYTKLNTIPTFFYFFNNSTEIISSEGQNYNNKIIITKTTMTTNNEMSAGVNHNSVTSVSARNRI